MEGRAFSIAVDLRHGGRWTSLRGLSGKEWLWRRAGASGREDVQPSGPFVDVGGVEECLPTICGEPDHGDIWTREWTGGDDDATVETDAFALRRQLRVGTSIIADYALTSERGYRFIWSWHGLFDPVPGLEVVAPVGHEVWAWPDHYGEPVRTVWPAVLERRGFERLGDDDGSSLFCLLPGLRQLSLRDGDDVLNMRLELNDQPFAMAVWRNLRGYPWDGSEKYRSFGIEPMIGLVHTLAKAGPDEAGVVPASGVVEWRLTLGGES